MWTASTAETRVSFPRVEDVLREEVPDKGGWQVREADYAGHVPGVHEDCRWRETKRDVNTILRGMRLTDRRSVRRQVQVEEYGRSW